MKYTRLPSGDTSYCVPKCPVPIAGTLRGESTPNARLSAEGTTHGRPEQPPLDVDVEQLSAITSPHGLITSTAGNHDALRRDRQAPHRDFRPAGLLGYVCEPTAFGGEPRVPFDECLGQQRLCGACAFRRDRPDVHSAPVAYVDNEGSSVRRPVGGLAVSRPGRTARERL
jgi:hypothetical protein